MPPTYWLYLEIQSGFTTLKKNPFCISEMMITTNRYGIHFNNLCMKNWHEKTKGQKHPFCTSHELPKYHHFEYRSHLWHLVFCVERLRKFATVHFNCSTGICLPIKKSSEKSKIGVKIIHVKIITFL